MERGGMAELTPRSPIIERGFFYRINRIQDSGKIHQFWQGAQDLAEAKQTKMGEGGNFTEGNGGKTGGKKRFNHGCH
jgi:hypothetical protein